MLSRNIKSKQLKKRVKNYRPTPAKFLWPKLSFSIVYFKNMKKNKISPKSAGEATISYSNFKIAECGRGTPPPTPTPSRALRPRFRRYALLVPPFHQQSPLHFFPLANALSSTSVTGPVYYRLTVNV